MAKDKKTKTEGKKARLAEKKQKQEKKGEKKEKAKNAKATEYVVLSCARPAGTQPHLLTWAPSA
jgi:hypothetical protein